MSLLFYNAIYSNKYKAKALKKASKENFELFERYLEYAIQSQKNKRVSSRWKPVEEGKIITFTPLFTLVEVEFEQTVQIDWSGNWHLVTNLKASEIDVEKDIILMDQRKFVSLGEDEIKVDHDNRLFIKLEENITPEEEILWGTKKIEIEFLNLDKELTISQAKLNSSVKVERVIRNHENQKLNIVIKGNLYSDESILVNGLEFDKWKLYHIDSSDVKIFNDKSQEIEIIEQKNNLFYLKEKISDDEILLIDKIPIRFSVKKPPIPENIFYKGKNIKIYQEKKDYRVYDYLDLIEDKLTVKRDEYSQLEYKISLLDDNSSEYYLWIELIDEDDSDSGNYSSFSKMDIFFQYGVEELEDDPGKPYYQRQIFQIKARVPEENKLLISHKKYMKKISYEELPEKLFININTYQLEKQKEAMRLIRTMPLKEHKSLLALTERKKDNNPWNKFSPESVNKWYLLTDINYQGTEKQRSFVEKSLATEDFVLLEGPPGSGKTTAIMELIVQLIQRGKRVLLSASTHVAIDNVLERLKEKKLIGETGILPLRIGDEGIVSNTVEEFQIDNIAAEDSEYRNLIIESANLVCGTTIGILQHPLFKESKGRNKPAIPEYDYLIIDESSKTTFQEFLVPAIYAKKWILVGDIKQLSPYSDQEDLVANFENIINKRGRNLFNENAQKAVLILFNYVYTYNPNLNRTHLCIVEKEEIVDRIMLELDEKYKLEGIDNKSSFPQIAFFERQSSNNPSNDCPLYQKVSLSDCLKGQAKSWILPAADLIFVKEDELEDLKKFIPANMLVINRTDWDYEKQQYQMSSYYDRFDDEFFYRDSPRGKKENDPDKIIEKQNRFLKEKKWAEEVVWRMVRIYELRFSSKSTDWADRHIKYLTPYINNNEVEKKYQIVKDIALPSILESLKKGVGKRREEDESTVLNSGFDREILESRYECLDYQHRMHPEISSFPREQFYKREALLDSEKLESERQWTYDRYLSRSTWVNVNGYTNKKNYNLQEADRLVEELKHFVSWAKDNPKPNKELWTAACLSFYTGQIRQIKEKMREYTGLKRKNSQFLKDGVRIVLYTVDKFQGREADVVFLSMVQTNRDGFTDSPNRLNVAVTRARYQRVILGKRSYFLKSSSDALKNLAAKSKKID